MMVKMCFSYAELVEAASLFHRDAEPGKNEVSQTDRSLLHISDHLFPFGLPPGDLTTPTCGAMKKHNLKRSSIK